MKNRFTLVFSVILLLFLVSCDKEEIRLVDYLVEFATVVETESSVTFQLDNGNILTPNDVSKINMENGDRLILNYTPLEDGFININSIRKIFVNPIKEEGYPHKLETNPIKIISVWVSGKYLNMSIQVDYHSKSHSAALYRDMQAHKPTLYFSYTRNDDPPGAPKLNYLSFNLESLQKEDFTVYINTYEGERKVDFKIN